MRLKVLLDAPRSSGRHNVNGSKDVLEGLGRAASSEAGKNPGAAWWTEKVRTCGEDELKEE